MAVINSCTVAMVSKTFSQIGVLECLGCPGMLVMLSHAIVLVMISDVVRVRVVRWRGGSLLR